MLITYILLGAGVVAFLILLIVALHESDYGINPYI